MYLDDLALEKSMPMCLPYVYVFLLLFEQQIILFMEFNTCLGLLQIMHEIIANAISSPPVVPCITKTALHKLSLYMYIYGTYNILTLLEKCIILFGVFIEDITHLTGSMSYI